MDRSHVSSRPCWRELQRGGSDFALFTRVPIDISTRPLLRVDSSQRTRKSVSRCCTMNENPCCSARNRRQEGQTDGDPGLQVCTTPTSNAVDPGYPLASFHGQRRATRGRSVAAARSRSRLRLRGTRRSSESWGQQDLRPCKKAGGGGGVGGFHPGQDEREARQRERRTAIRPVVQLREGSEAYLSLCHPPGSDQKGRPRVEKVGGSAAPTHPG